jgi:hypothetical protein
MARETAAASRMSPSAISTSRPWRFTRLLGFRSKARTRKPAPISACNGRPDETRSSRDQNFVNRHFANLRWKHCNL